MPACRRRLLAAALLSPLLSVLAAPVRADGTPLPVIASGSVLADMVGEIGGPDVRVARLAGPEGDVCGYGYGYGPTVGDVQDLSKARLLVVNGLGLEPWLPWLLQAAAYRGPVAVASRGVEPLLAPAGTGPLEEGVPDPQARPDPHAWMDPRNARLYAETIAAALAAADPAHAAAYRLRLTEYRRRLAALDARVRAALRTVPEEKRRAIGEDRGLAYYGRAYGVRFVPAPAAPAADIDALIGVIRASGIKAVYLDGWPDRRLRRGIARLTGANFGPPLYAEALSDPAGPAPTYLDMIDYDTAVLIAGMRRN